MRTNEHSAVFHTSVIRERYVFGKTYKLSSDSGKALQVIFSILQ